MSDSSTSLSYRCDGNHGDPSKEVRIQGAKNGELVSLTFKKHIDLQCTDSPICGKQACGDFDLLNLVCTHRRQLHV